MKGPHVPISMFHSIYLLDIVWIHVSQWNLQWIQMYYVKKENFCIKYNQGCERTEITLCGLFLRKLLGLSIWNIKIGHPNTVITNVAKLNIWVHCNFVILIPSATKIMAFTIVLYFTTRGHKIIVLKSLIFAKIEGAKTTIYTIYSSCNANWNLFFFY